MAVVPCSNEICELQISQVRNVQGSPFLTVPPVGICSAPCICITSLQRLTEFPFLRKQNKRIRLPLQIYSTSAPKVYMDVRYSTGYFQKADGRGVFNIGGSTGIWPLHGSNGRSAYIILRFLSTLPDAFVLLLEKCAKFCSKFRTERGQPLKAFLMRLH